LHQFIIRWYWCGWCGRTERNFNFTGSSAEAFRVCKIKIWRSSLIFVSFDQAKEKKRDFFSELYLIITNNKKALYEYHTGLLFGVKNINLK